MKINRKHVQCWLGRYAGWIRIYGLLAHWTSEPPLFSERYGFRRAVVRIGVWRLFVETDFFPPHRQQPAVPQPSGCDTHSGNA